jgi:hypothetical protein
MPTSYKDLGKSAKDLLGKGFDGNNSVKVSTKAPNGVTYNAEVKAKGGNKIAGKVGAKFKHSSGINFKKFEISNNGTLASDVTLEDAVDDVTFTLNVAMQPMDLSDLGEKCEVGLKYNQDKVNFGVSVSPLLPTAVDASLVIKATDNILIGGTYGGQLDDTWVNKKDGISVSYSDAGATVALVSSGTFSKFGLSAFRKHDDKISLAADLQLTRANPASAALTVGGSYKIDGDTSVKAKINVPKGSAEGSTASLGFNHKLNSTVRLTAASQIQLDPNDHLFGASFAMGLEFGSV